MEISQETIDFWKEERDQIKADLRAGFVQLSQIKDRLDWLDEKLKSVEK